MANQVVTINRAPVLTLWAAVVAEQLGFDSQEALTLGKVLAGLNAQSKGQRLGIYEPRPEQEQREQARRRPQGEEYAVYLMGREVPAANTGEGVRATVKGQPVNPASVERYLKQKFRDDLPAVEQAMRELAAAFPPEDLARRAFGLYERFRPDIPEGKRGWGAAGQLDLGLIRSLRSLARA